MPMSLSTCSSTAGDVQAALSKLCGGSLLANGHHAAHLLTTPSLHISQQPSLETFYTARSGDLMAAFSARSELLSLASEELGSIGPRALNFGLHSRGPSMYGNGNGIAGEQRGVALNTAGSGLLQSHNSSMPHTPTGGAQGLYGGLFTPGAFYQHQQQQQGSTGVQSLANWLRSDTAVVDGPVGNGSSSSRLAALWPGSSSLSMLPGMIAATSSVWESVGSTDSRSGLTAGGAATTLSQGAD